MDGGQKKEDIILVDEMLIELCNCKVSDDLRTFGIVNVLKKRWCHNKYECSLD